MADDTIRVIDLPIKATGGISLADFLMGIDANEGYQMLISDLAKKIIESYSGSSLAGSAQSLKSALDGIGTKIGDATMGTTATTLTGAIAEHEDDINGINGINAKIGNTSMGTTATTLTGAIAEHEDDIEDINDLVGNTSMGTTATTLTGAIAEHESDISTLNSKLTNKNIPISDVLTIGSGLKILSAQAYGNDYMIELRISISKNDSSVFSGRVNPLFTFKSPYIPKVIKAIPAVTNATISGLMTGYADVYMNNTGTVLADIITSNQKQIDVHVCYLL